MIARALLAFLALPGVVAGLTPALIVFADGRRGRGWVGGWALAAAGALLLIWCVRDFLVSGRGTLAPWDPPTRLVTVGMYRFVRNPMYVAVVTLVAGWAMAAGSRWLLAYVVALAVAFHLRVVLYEEPRLRREFGAQWEAYRASVGRWVPRLGRR